MATKMKTTLYCGHLSGYGLAFIEPLMRSDLFEINRVVLATYGRYRRFKTDIAGEKAYSSLGSRIDYQIKTKRVINKFKFIKPEIGVVFCDDVNKQSHLEKLAQSDLNISIAYPQIFNQAFLQMCCWQAINFHPSYLPRCRGARPIYWAIASGESYSGLTCHIITDSIDGGPIVAQRKIDFNKETITYELLFELIIKEIPNLVSDVELFFRNSESARDQEGEGSYFKEGRSDYRKIIFENDSIEQIEIKLRAGGAFAIGNGKDKILLSSPFIFEENTCRDIKTESYIKAAKGTILDCDQKQIMINVGEKVLTCAYQVKGKNPILRALVRLTGIKKYFMKRPQVGEKLD